MQSTQTITADKNSGRMFFKDYLFQDKTNRSIIIGSIIISIALFAVLKYFYPFASYIHGDSFSYIDAANENRGINIHMIGYSMFLRLFSVFSVSDSALVTFQYLLLQASSLFFLFTLFYFYSPHRLAQWILLSFMVLNPLFLYMSNMISADALFLSLSLIWFSLLLWIVHRPCLKLIFWHTIVIYITFTVRYNALIYFFISVVAFILSQQSLQRKLFGITAAALVISLFIIHTGNLYKQLTGKWQYSPFSGWQIANNAMYSYRYVDSAIRKPVPPRFKELDNMVRNYFDSTRNISKYPTERLLASTVYMWTPNSPLSIYRDLFFKKDSLAERFRKWASMGPLYNEYGWYIIKKYPLHFTKYFLWPNATKYYAPPIEFLESYNSGRDTVKYVAKTWFRYNSQKVTTRTMDLEIRMLDFYPILSGVNNLLMTFGLISVFLLTGLQQNRAFKKGIILAGTAWILNAAFTVFASSAALRFQAFPILFTTTFVGLLIDYLWKIGSSPEIQARNQAIRVAHNETIGI